MEGHQTSSSGGAEIRACPEVCLTDVDSKRAPKNFSLRTNQLESILLFGGFQLHQMGSSSATLLSIWRGSIIMSPMFSLLRQVLLLIMTKMLRILTIKYYYPSLGYSREILLILLCWSLFPLLPHLSYPILWIPPKLFSSLFMGSVIVLLLFFDISLSRW